MVCGLKARYLCLREFWVRNNWSIYLYHRHLFFRVQAPCYVHLSCQIRAVIDHWPPPLRPGTPPWLSSSRLSVVWLGQFHSCLFVLRQRNTLHYLRGPHFLWYSVITWKTEWNLVWKVFWILREKESEHLKQTNITERVFAESAGRWKARPLNVITMFLILSEL